MLAPRYSFTKMGFETLYFMMNMSDTLTIIFFVSMIIPVVSILKLLLPTNSFMIRMDNFIKGRFLVMIVNVTYLKVSFLALLNFKNLNIKTPLDKFNSFSATFAICYILMVPTYWIFQIAIYY